MNLLVILFFFVISSSIALLLFLRFGFRKKIGCFLVLIISYGVGPFLPSLLFYFLIYLFPAKEDFFYLSILVISYCVIFILCKNRITELKNMHFDVASRLICEVKNQCNVAVVAVLFIGVYSFQLFSFPIIDNDSASYLNQSEAVHEYKNMDWQEETDVIINENDFYKYNPAIRPGIPSFNAATYLFRGKTLHNFFAFKFLIFYYYILLLLFFMFIIGKISKNIGFSEKKSLAYGLIFFVFSWGLSRSLIFSSKEVIIYFLALFSAYVASLLIDYNKDSKNRFQLLTILAILLGVNSFVNLHGIIIEVIIVFVLFILSKNKFIDRIKEMAYILLVSFPLGGFEFLTHFNFMFLIPTQALVSKIILKTLTTADTSIINNTSSQIANAKTSYQNIYQNLYHFKNIQDEYSKGKFQILTNIYAFGVYFWMYLVIVFSYFKNILKNNLLKFLLLFTIVYYLIVIDPFNIIKHPLMIVLTGSQKYAMLLLFLSIIPTAIFLDKIIQRIANLMKKYHKKFILGGTIFIIAVIFSREIIIKFLLKILLKIVPDFHYGAVEKMYYLLIFATLFSLIMLLISVMRKEKKWIVYLLNIFIAFIIVAPFLATNVGKITLKKTFSYINKDTQFKLENTLYEGDIFKVYFKAKNMLPMGTLLAVDYSEIYAYDDYFSLRYLTSDADAQYLISANCEEENWKMLIYSNGVCLCERKKL